MASAFRPVEEVIVNRGAWEGFDGLPAASRVSCFLFQVCTKLQRYNELTIVIMRYLGFVILSKQKLLE